MFNNNRSCFLQSRQKYSKKQRYDEFIDEPDHLFNKKFQFRFNKEWKLSECKLWFTSSTWELKELQILKHRLNFHKSQLNDFNIEEWSSHTSRRNPAGEVCWKLRMLINPEFPTQAWTKFYECAFTYNIVPKIAVNDKKMVSLHLCEAPGAFITSFNHYLQSCHREIEWKWVANTLNPYYEGNSQSNMISDDRFMLHTLDNWDFGVDNTGNLMNWENSQAIINKAQSFGKVLLVTADGSFDCLQKPDVQEEITSPLHYCEIVTALQALYKGGTFIYKLFTIFEHSTVCLLYLLNQLFHEVNIYKPVTSRQGNSEVYAICLNYKGKENLLPYISTLKSAYGTELYSELAMFPLGSLPQDFLKQIEECANYFCSLQCQVINNNLQAYLMQKNISLHTDIKRIRSAVASQFIQRYSLNPLLYEQEILKGILHEENKINTNPRYDRGSYTERQLYSKLSLKEKVKTFNTFLQADILSNPMIFISEPIRWLSFYDEQYKFAPVFTCGTPVQGINSSKFIFVPIFRLYQQIIGEEEFKDLLANNVTLVKPSDKTYSEKLELPEYNKLEVYDTYEKKCLQTLLLKLSDISVGSSLLLLNFNILTHFNVSILYILSKKYFERIGFVSNGGIILDNLKNKSELVHLNVVEKECIQKRELESKSVLNVLPVKITNSGEFFNHIVFYNNTFYKNKCIEFLSSIEQTF